VRSPSRSDQSAVGHHRTAVRPPLARPLRRAQIGGVNPEQRHRIERRLVPDRRRGFERRLAERRFAVDWADVERRLGEERRDGERRSRLPRRRLRDRRGSGLTFTERDPS